MNSFYVVWCPTQGPPTVRHMEYHLAVKEATRLAAANHGLEFFVLQATDRLVRMDVQHDHLADPVPF